MKQIDKLILCSSYNEPHAYWDRDAQTQEFFKAEGRRPAGYVVADPSSKKGSFVAWINANKWRLAILLMQSCFGRYGQYQQYSCY